MPIANDDIQIRLRVTTLPPDVRALRQARRALQEAQRVLQPYAAALERVDSAIVACNVALNERRPAPDDTGGTL